MPDGDAENQPNNLAKRFRCFSLAPPFDLGMELSDLRPGVAAPDPDAAARIVDRALAFARDFVASGDDRETRGRFDSDLPGLERRTT